MTKDLPSPELLRKLIRYDPETGKLFWRTRTADMFPHTGRAARICKTFNSQLAGKEAFTSLNGDGYQQGTIFGRYYPAHRVIWSIHYGTWPDDQIDHINGVRNDNRIENLRDVSQHENQRNAKKRDDNTSGVTGVYRDKATGKWEARIRVYGRLKYLGSFGNIEDAASARKAAEAEFGFHKNHGKR